MNILRYIVLIFVLCISHVALAADEIREDLSVTIIGDSIPIIRKGGAVTIVHPNEDAIPNIQKAILRNINDDILNDSVDLFTNPKRRHKSFQAALVRSAQYIKMVQTIFKEAGLPEPLAWLPLIESEYSPYAVSEASAVGMWQFMEGTGKRYGLRVDRYIDERKDPLKSTVAAAAYLKDLYEQMKDLYPSDSDGKRWRAVLMSYNVGENKIIRVQQKCTLTGKDLLNNKEIPLETKRYPHLMIAALTIKDSPEEYGFKKAEQPSELEYKTYVINQGKKKDAAPSNINVFARKCHVKAKEIRDLNPAITGDWLPPYEYKLILPERAVLPVITVGDKIK
jgi:membrane-bound lytic murein transglycosylase D